MTGTVVDSLNDATAAVNAAVARLNKLEDTLDAKITAAQTAASTVINNFTTRPLLQNIFVDASNGSDGNDGLTINTPKRSIDLVLDAIGLQGVQILLLSDVLIKENHPLYTDIGLTGIQPASNTLGYIQTVRTVSFLSTSTNSPSPYVGSTTAGFIFSAGSLVTQSINFVLPDQPGNLNIHSHIVSRCFLNVLMLSPTITVGTQQAGALLASAANGRITATLNPVLGPGAAGHLFENIPAGADPNAVWVYSSNIKSA